MSEANGPAPAVARGLRILTALADTGGEPLTLSDLARTLNIAKSSTANLCAVLEEGRMIARTPAGYVLGRRTAELGGAFAMQFNQIREFFGVCSASSQLRHEVVQVAMLDGIESLYLARHEGRSPYRVGTPLGSRLSVALSAAGNALLMPISDEQVRDLLSDAEPFPALTDKSVRTMTGLLAKLDAARTRGYALDREESFAGITGVAVPLDPWMPSDPGLAIGAALPSETATDERIAEVGAALIDAAVQLTNPLANNTPIARGETS